ncbi:hypothetical protein SAMN06264364_101457 [Quadrisphaera granulorum]|uniref:Uncharacterized protein n=2 Tax=Quadrisphaera granulorum TaxID=317664 RepID=A0A316AGS0_9ACTN|nr:hypothetical protein BXY45_101457 [Quadrisphaera granulorum]SZE95113.1 hypothetical protein SAMN06264364_101457 [Quadrisphaera granulorum]
MAAATLLAALAVPFVGSGIDSGTGVDEARGPYGVPGCLPRADEGRVDVTVTARALTAQGSTAASLGGDGPTVGASVRDLAGYAAQDLSACKVVQVTVHLHDTAADAWVPGSLEQAPSPVEIDDVDGGRLVAVDFETWRASLPAQTREGYLQHQASWLVTLVHPVPGTYRLTGRVTADDAAASTGDVEVLVTLTASRS